jgi:hypothetical protein
MSKRTLMFSLALAASAFVARPAAATPAFQAAFMKHYVTNSKNEDWVKLAKEAKCNICHQGPKVEPKNIHHNAYGKELMKLLEAKKDNKNAKKIQEALQKVAKIHTDSKDKKSPTFGELIEKGKLPGGDLKESKRALTDEEKAKDDAQIEKIKEERAKQSK